MKQLNFMKNAKIFVVLSVLLVLSGIIGLFTVGFTEGIDFSGGSVLTLDMGTAFTEADVPAVDAVLGKYVSGDKLVSVSEGTRALLRYNVEEEKELELHDNVLNDLKQTYPDVKIASLEFVGPTASDELTLSALTSVLVACALILIYIWIRFEIVFGLAAIVALAHDVIIIAAFMIFTRTQINSSFIAALLTIVGYSINDTIVVFDRVRENLKKHKNVPRVDIINRSYSETLVRTLNTSLTTLFTITALYVLGVQSIKEFALPLIVGIVAGTYSSILIASPVWLWIHNAIDKRNRDKHNKNGSKKQLKPSKSKA